MPFSDASRYGYLDDVDIDTLRLVFDRLIIENNVKAGSPAYEALAKAIVGLPPDWQTIPSLTLRRFRTPRD